MTPTYAPGILPLIYLMMANFFIGLGFIKKMPSPIQWLGIVFFLTALLCGAVP